MSSRHGRLAPRPNGGSRRSLAWFPVRHHGVPIQVVHLVVFLLFLAVTKTDTVAAIRPRPQSNPKKRPPIKARPVVPKPPESTTSRTNRNVGNRRSGVLTLSVVRSPSKSTATIVLSRPWAVTLAAVLALNAGFINGACLSGGIIYGIKQAVTSVSNAWTTLAYAWAGGNPTLVRQQATLVASYWGGAAVAGFWLPQQPPEREEPWAGNVSLRTTTTTVLSPRTGPLFLVGAVGLFWASQRATSPRGAGMEIFHVVAAACGLQQAILRSSTSSSSGLSFLGTTSLVGDTGRYLGQWLRSGMSSSSQAPGRILVNVIVLLSFWTGAFVSFTATQDFAPATLLFSAILFAVIGMGIMGHTLMSG